MSEYVTNEALAQSARKRIFETAHSMISGDISFIEGARTLSNLRHSAAIRDDDPDFMIFVGIDSETDALPIGAVRQYWSIDALAKLDREIEKAEAWAKQFGINSCESLVQRFHHPVSPNG
ncbi:MAG: DUF2489 domain-containing protein [Burkholderiaceae bacterium]|nr:DUF2489 domain-containing protein [Burkholderiaceae bacterium]